MPTPLPSVESLGEDQLDALRSVRFQLAAAGYSEEGLRNHLAIPESHISTLYFDRLDPTHMAFPEAGPSRLDLLIQLFLVGHGVAHAAVADALSPEAWQALQAAGLIYREGEIVRGATAWVPAFGVLVLCDFRSRRGERDFVFFPDQSSAVVARYLEGGSTTGELAVDMGTGSGLSAFVIARKGTHRRVVGLDMNPRAIAFARVAAVINGLPVAFEVVAADSLARREPATVDLLSFVLPHLYTSHNTHAVSVHADDAERLLDEVYGSLDRILTGRGEAVLFHQARTPVAPWLKRRLSGVPGRERLHVEHTSLPNKMVNAEFGLSHIRRRAGAEEDFLHHESDTLEIDRAVAEARRETALALRSEGWLDAVLLLRPGLVVSDCHMEHHGRLVACGRLLGNAAFEPELSEAVFRVDGTRTAREVLGPNDSPSSRAALERCLRRGELRLRRSRS